MSEHVAEDRLNDYVDDLLPPDERAALDAHLAACAACRTELAAHAALIRRLHALPAAIEPPAALRQATLGAGRRERSATAGPARWRALRGIALPLAAAALVLVVATALLTRWLVQEPAGGRGRVASAVAPSAPAGRAPAPGPAAEVTTGKVAVPSGASGLAATPDSAVPPPHARAPVPASFVRDERRYAAEIADLQRQLERQRARLSPATVAILERNLRVIDRAIAESRAALASDPGDRILGRLILSAYEQKVELLKRATSFAS